jgi:serine protease
MRSSSLAHALPSPADAQRLVALGALALALAGGLLLSPRPALAQTTQLLVDLHDDTDDDDERAVEAKLGGLDLRLNSVQAAEERLFIVDVPRERLAELVRAVAGDPRVSHAEENTLYTASYVPDDPRYGEQWNLPMIGAPAAWDHARGKGVIVAVIDTGIAYQDGPRFKAVEDLAGADFVEGYDFVNDRVEALDDHGHGTHVAGTIAQRTGNGRGVAGVAFEATLMPLKVLSAQGSGTAADIADAIYFAADEGARVINMSLGGGSASAVMGDAVAYARKKGVVVVCAAGNNGRGVVEYPAAYPGAFAVSAVGPSGELASYSSWGKELAIAAPGGDTERGGTKAGVLQNTIDPTRPGATDVYLAFNGTSMATPHVAGAAALVISAGVTDADDVERILRASAKDVGGQAWSERYGDGLLDVAAAAQQAAGDTRGGWHFLAVMILLAMFAWRVGRLPGARVGLGVLGVLGAILAARGVPIPGLGILSHPIAGWDLFTFGARGYHTALWASMLPMGVAAVALLGWKKGQGLVMGLTLGWAAYLLVSAVGMPADVQGVPGLAGALDRVWLVANALGLLGLARLLVRVRA